MPGYTYTETESRVYTKIHKVDTGVYLEVDAYFHFVDVDVRLMNGMWICDVFWWQIEHDFAAVWGRIASYVSCICTFWLLSEVLSCTVSVAPAPTIRTGCIYQVGFATTCHGSGDGSDYSSLRSRKRCNDSRCRSQGTLHRDCLYIQLKSITN